MYIRYIYNVYKISSHPSHPLYAPILHFPYLLSPSISFLYIHICLFLPTSPPLFLLYPPCLPISFYIILPESYSSPILISISTFSS